MKKGDSKLSGFTIIEVVLVLAIAGLIFMMIFVALPALQRSQRDATRKDDIATFLAAVKKYQTNNRGALPEGTGSFGYKANPTSATSWEGFYKSYLGDNFKDPEGAAYTLQVSKCDKNIGANCLDTNLRNQEMDFKLYVVENAGCNENSDAVKIENPRKLAIVYRLEADVYCADS